VNTATCQLFRIFIVFQKEIGRLTVIKITYPKIERFCFFSDSINLKKSFKVFVRDIRLSFSAKTDSPVFLYKDLSDLYIKRFYTTEFLQFLFYLQFLMFTLFYFFIRNILFLSFCTLYLYMVSEIDSATSLFKINKLSSVVLSRILSICPEFVAVYKLTG